jgi:hypothetical protein
MGVSGQRRAPAALYPRGKGPRYPLYRRLGGPQSQPGLRGNRKNPLPLPRIEPGSPGRPVCSQTLYWQSLDSTGVSVDVMSPSRQADVFMEPYSAIQRPSCPYMCRRLLMWRFALNKLERFSGVYTAVAGLPVGCRAMRYTAHAHTHTHTHTATHFSLS